MADTKVEVVTMVGGTAEVTTAVEVITAAATVMAEAMGAAVMAVAITEVADPAAGTTAADRAMEVTGVEGLVTATVASMAEAMAVGIMAEVDPAMIVTVAVAMVTMAAESLATTAAEANPAGMTAAVASPAAITVVEDLAESAEVATAAAMVARTIAATNAKPNQENRTQEWTRLLGSIRCSIVEWAHCAGEPKIRVSEKPDRLSRCADPSVEDLKRDAPCVPFCAMGTNPRKPLGRLTIPDRRRALPSLMRSGAPQRLRLRLRCRGRLGERSPAA